QPKAVHAVERAEGDLRPEPVRLAKHDIGRTGIFPVGGRQAGAEDQVVEAISIHVAGSGDGVAAALALGSSNDREPDRGLKFREIDDIVEQLGSTENDVAEPTCGKPVIIETAIGDDEIAKSIVIQVAGCGN